MENDEIKSTIYNDKKMKTPSKMSVFTVFVLFALSISVLFSVIQAAYIFKLQSGQTGNMTYTNGRENELVAYSNSNTTQHASPVANPSFSLTESASVTDPNKQTLSVVEIADLVGPATVSIYTLSESDLSTPLSSGTGFIISEDGYVVTNEHVVADAFANEDLILEVVIPNHDTPVRAEVVGTDVQTDIAVIKLEGEEAYPSVVLGSSDVLQQGELVIAIGNPLGTLSGTVTVGVVSALDRQMNNNGYSITLIQTDASINHGNSGGPLINSFGEVIGVINAKMSSAEGLGFAIPIDDVKGIIESLINYGYVANRTYLGISISTVYENAFYGAVEGLYVAEINEGGPGEAAGFMIGDRIISMDGIEINESSDIIDIRNSHVAGDEVIVVIERDGREMELTLTIGDAYLGK